jgi:hypothetical protein
VGSKAACSGVKLKNSLVNALNRKWKTDKKFNGAWVQTEIKECAQAPGAKVGKLHTLQNLFLQARTKFSNCGKQKNSKTLADLRAKH